ncbi:MAG: response regulator [Oscillospiraceae bacterium]|nr:response regulator [Oscillospiraceae bacterium]
MNYYVRRMANVDPIIMKQRWHMTERNNDNQTAELESLRRELAQLKREREERIRCEFISNNAMREALRQDGPEDEINCFLASIGKGLAVDRIYIFEDNFEADETSNTYEWCAENVNPEIENLQNIPRSVVTWWYDQFELGNDIHILDLEAIRETEPESYSYLAPQGIQSLIAKRIIVGDKVIGFFGVDNPRLEMMKDISAFLDTLSNFIAALLQHRNILHGHKARYVAELEKKNAALNEALRKTEASEKQVAALAAYRNTMITVTHEALHSGMWSMDFDKTGSMTAVHWSQEFRRMLGYKDTTDFPDTLEAWSDLLHPDDREPVLKEFHDTVADYENKKSYDVEYRLRMKDGEWRWFHAMGRLIRRQDGTPRNYVGVFVDTTEKRRQTQLLAEALQEAKEANAAKSEFLSNMSHDIRTPLNGIIGMTAIAAEHLDDRDRVEDCLHKITLSGKHLLGLINDVLDMAKIESGKMSLHMEELSLRETMNAICDITRVQIKEKAQNFDIFISNILCENVCCDSVRLNQVLLNLLSNAIKFTPEEGSITVRLWQEASPKGDDHVLTHFSVADTGIGMSPEFQETIFEAFTREDAKRVRKTQGTGLGMAISKRIVDSMGGTIEVESMLDMGTTFHIVLDLKRADSSEDELELPPWNILVVDDNEDLCRTASESLRELGTRPQWCTDGNQAVKMVVDAHARGEDFYAVLIDYRMPGMSGVETAKRIRELLGDKNPVEMISAYDWTEIRGEVETAGVSGFIPKPLFKSTLYYELCRFAPETAVPQGKEKEQEELSLKGMHILLAEDNDINAEIALMILEENGAVADRAEDGQMAVQLFEESEPGTYSAILMDLRMPHMDGLEATGAIRDMARDDAKTVPIIAMTADAFSEDAQRCLNAGMNAHLPKPIDIDVLKRTLIKFINGDR